MFQPVIKWTGSKRSQASQLVKLFPKFSTYYEPFVGGGSVLYALGPSKAVCGDICKPLIDLWTLIQKNPDTLIKQYDKDWNKLQNEGYHIYYDIRDRFNEYGKPEDLFFLSRTCVNGLIRFNKAGAFNNSLHHTRRGINPNRISSVILDWSEKIQDVKFVHKDYRGTIKNANSDDFVYLDPPYHSTTGRYFGKIDSDELIKTLRDLNENKIKFILSYDGIRENKFYLKDLPKDLYKRHLFLESGNSAFKKTMSKKVEMVSESVYLNW